MMWILSILCLIATLLFFLKKKYFTLRGPIPGLSPHFVFGNLIQSGILLSGKCTPEVMANFKETYGDVFQFWFGPRRSIVVNNIKDVQHIFTHRNIYEQGEFFIRQLSVLGKGGLNTIIGHQYKRHASIIMPLFRRAKIIDNFDLIVDCTDKLLFNWRARPNSHIHCDIAQQCQNLLLEIFGLVSFDYDLETLDENTSTQNELAMALQDFLKATQFVFFSPPLIGTIYTKLSRRHRQAKSIITKYIYRMIDKECTANSESRTQRKRKCLIASLISSLQEDEELEAKKNENEKKGLSRAEVLQELLTFLVAGSETTSTALAWFIYYMSKYPQVQQKIKDELMNTESQSELLLNRLDSLVYLDCVINETLRYSPPFPGTARTLTADDHLPETGIRLFKGESVFIPFYNLAYDDRYWSVDPKIFYPERFSNEDKNHHSYALLPFGAGHRQCVGQDLARFELKVILARMMQKVTFIDAGPTLNSGGHTASLTIMPKKIGVIIDFS